MRRSRRTVRRLALRILVACGLAASGSSLSALAADLAPGRAYEPVVVAADHLPGWVGAVDLTELNFFRFESDGTWTAIPFQIDKRRKINLARNVNDPAVLAGKVDICEYGYFRELGVEPGSPDDAFASNILAPKDELVFMVKDAGASRAPVTAWLGNPAEARIEIALTDPRTFGVRWVYGYHFPGGVPAVGPAARNTTRYVAYAPDDPGGLPAGCAYSPCPNCAPDALVLPCGTAQGINANLGGLATHRVHFLRNWVTDAYAVTASGAEGADFLDRFEFRCGMETEDTWSTVGEPRTLGVYTTDPGSAEHLVRVVRGVQGAASGVATTKYEFVYATEFVTRVNVRVHALPDLRARINHEFDVTVDTNPAALWTLWSFLQLSRPFDLVDGTGPQTEQDSSYARSWTEVSSYSRNRYLHFFREPRPLVADTELYSYRDSSRVGQIGAFGRAWTNVAATQDGEPINDGGCVVNDPESPSLNFKRLEYLMIPQPRSQDPTLPGFVSARMYNRNLLKPIADSETRQTYRPPTVP